LGRKWKGVLRERMKAVRAAGRGGEARSQSARLVLQTVKQMLPKNGAVKGRTAVHEVVLLLKRVL